MSDQDDPILSLSERGQITIPKKIRNQIAVNRFTCEIHEGGIILKPLQTREEFLKELDEAEEDWDKNGGLTLKEMEKKYSTE